MLPVEPLSSAQIGELPPGAQSVINLELLPGTLQRLVDLQHQHGDIYSLSTEGEEAATYVVAHPDYAQQVLSTRHADYRRFMVNGQMALVLGNGLLMSEGNDWKAQRKLLQRCFHGDVLTSFNQYTTAGNVALLQRWQRRADEGQLIELTSDMLDLSLNFNLQAVFSVDADDLLDAVGVQFLHRLSAPMRQDTRSSLIFLKHTKYVRTRIVELIVARRARRDPPFDLLNMFIDARYRDTGNAMLDQQIVDEILSILTAGHETVATGLKSVWYAISTNPKIAQLLREETDRVVGDAVPSTVHIASLPYARQVIQEALRIYPPIWVITRRAEARSRIGPYDVPAETNVLVSPYLIHRHADFWPQPEVFDPDRFAPDLVRNRHSHAYIPYGRGPRNCIGEELSMQEMLLHVSTFVRAFNVVHVDGVPGDYAAGFALRSQTPIYVRLESRG